MTHIADSVDWTATVGNYIKIAEFQLEKGSNKTSYQKLDYATELSRVQRYYEEGYFYAASNLDGDQLGGTCEYKTQKRDIPTIALDITFGTSIELNFSYVSGLSHYGFSSGNANYEFTYKSNARI